MSVGPRFKFEDFLRHHVLPYGDMKWRQAHGRVVPAPDATKFVAHYLLGRVSEDKMIEGWDYRADAEAAVCDQGKLYYRITESDRQGLSVQTWYYAGIAHELFRRAAGDAGFATF